ncbi:MAG TPA: alpha/beta hydrolase [Thermoleophilaceae bacterium]
MPTIRPSKALPATPWQAARAGDDYGATASPDWRSIDWRPHLHQIEIDGRSLNYVDYGSSEAGHEPVVFVHGLGGCWQNWLENIPRVAAEGRRAIAVDLPGFGFSEMPSDEISISGYGRVVNELCDRLDVGEVALVGNSMGGFISAETAIQFRARVARMVLVSAAGVTTSDLRSGPIMAGARLVAAVAARTATMSDRVVRRRHIRHLVYHSFIRHPTRIRNELLYEITRGSGRPGFLDALRAIMDYDFRDRLTEIGCPTLIVWGTEDMLVPSSDADEYERLIPQSRKLIFRDTGHMAMIERPQTFNDCLMEFLAEEPEPASSEAEVEAAGGGSR